MLDINLLRTNIDAVAKNLATKGYILDINKFNTLDFKRKQLQITCEDLQSKRNCYAKTIAKLTNEYKKLKDTDNHIDNILDDTFLASHHINNQLKVKLEELKVIQEELQIFLANIPNMLDDTVPYGQNEQDNVEVKRVGGIPTFDFPIKDHVELGFNLDKQIDFELANKISGSRFYVLKNKIAKLHRAIISLMLDTHTNNGYTEMYVPYMVNKKSAYNTAQLPKFEDDFFKTNHNNEDMYLISTAEIPLTNIIADTLLKQQDLPIKMVAHTPSFRSEAGSYGRDTRGMMRVHQFDKVELVQVVEPQFGQQALNDMLNHAASILEQLKLPYRIMLLCSGDTGFHAAKTYDIEVWVPSQNTYREISSCSLVGDFQARRMMGRYKNNKETIFPFTLNGSGLAVGRTLLAIIENYQNADGSISIPSALHKYTNFSKID